MKTKMTRSLTLFLAIIAASLLNTANAQTEETQGAKTDTTVQETTGKDKKKNRRKDEFIVFVGANLNQLSVSSTQFEQKPNIGYHLGGAYKRGKFFYWQVGARFNYAQYKLNPVNTSSDSANVVPVYGIDVPITGGINFLSFVNRVFALRLFVSAVPSFSIGVGSNDLGISKDNLNTFVFYGQGGIGFNVAFFLLEAGYNYGFGDQFKNDLESKPGQFFVNLGFRF